MAQSKWDDNRTVELFQEYLRIPSVHPDVNYDDCVKFLKSQAESLNLPIQVIEIVPKNPIVVMTWAGSSPELPSILLNSHMDVVPVNEEHWKYPPFEARIDDDGFIYARGTQDMKSIAILYIEAVRRLKASGIVLKRTVHILFVPDEELNGLKGMKLFVETPEFEALNVGFGLDESMPCPHDTIYAFYGERACWQIRVVCTGKPGHGSTLVPDTAGEKLQYMINKFLGYRGNEFKTLLTTNCWQGDLTSVNLTKIYGGVQVNVLPDKLCAEFDMRLAPHVDHEEFENMMNNWCKEAGDGVYIEFIVRDKKTPLTKIDDTNIYYTGMLNAAKKLDLKIDFVVCPGSTDARYIRSKGISMFGFSPFPNTPILLHAHNERLHVDTFLKGIDIFEEVIKEVANV